MTDTEVHLRKFQKELSTGTVSLVLLSALAQAKEPQYGYQIAKALEAAGKNLQGESLISGKQSAFYPVLRNLEGTGLLSSRVEPSISGPPRRYYEITETGRAVLRQWQAQWQQSKQFVDTILQGALS
jgi:PadR family transcriptional regulator, regulatory protein PadR